MNPADLPAEFQETLRDLTDIVRRHREDGVESATAAIERLSRDEAQAVLLVATLLFADDAVVAVLRDRGEAHAAT